MAKIAIGSVDEYIARQPRAAQPTLQRVRALIRKAIPEAEEVISYSIPAYRVHGSVALYFAGWKEHYSLYPVSEALVEAFGDALAPYEQSHKGTIRFELSRPVPSSLITRFAKFKADEAAERAAAKALRTAAKKKTAAKKAPAKKKKAPAKKKKKKR